jgi:hypothetical protein
MCRLLRADLPMGGLARFVGEDHPRIRGRHGRQGEPVARAQGQVCQGTRSFTQFSDRKFYALEE